ncbi:tRNA cyclic N6-threonylcarbamoyladenosine(37) synthase TcdA [Marinospirillum perlucidum]|uniref:tRNA cyclic N6-threonylcarbamoyladenosine(37) synthase TcdA n=1 Tax=Marinospirillum perlucidum TaxID=1982602 RepID=UPI000DF3A74C|nr:tRNA cyclic N6-threonylcarbamoyladenosine(37) synthase TcdA [Marinospirillum perlucidum]
MSSTSLSADYLYRFGGLARLYGQEGLETLSRARIAIIGIGGVGSWAAEALARSGVGALTLFDLDDLCTSNINRQLPALDSTIGRPKVEAMAERIREINPAMDLEPLSQFVTLKNLETSLTRDGQKHFDVIIDATDTVPVKAGLIAWCRRNKQKLVVVGGAGGQLDPSLITTADLARTSQDPLLAKVRNLLRREYGFSRNPKRRFEVECVYSTEQLIYPQVDGSVARQKPGAGDAMKLDCSSGFGSACFVTGSFGFLAAQRALRKLMFV